MNNNFIHTHVLRASLHCARAALAGYVLATLAGAMSVAAGVPGAPPIDIIKDLGTKTLGVVFSITGVVAALAFALNGVKLVVASVSESSRSAGGSLVSFGICALGVALAFTGPTIAKEVITAIDPKKEIYVP